MAISETEVVGGIKTEYKFGFHDPEDYFFKSGRGLSPELALELEKSGYKQWEKVEA